MKDKILQYLSKYTVITKELEKAIAESTFIQCFKKGEILLKKGSTSNECYFIIKGCIRSYYLKDGDEKTIEFYTEDEAVIPLNYDTIIPSGHYLECVEETIVSVGNPELESETFQKFPELATLSRIIGEKIMAQQQESFADYKMSTPEERYLNLVKRRPDLIQRVPQHQIASYLSIKPESLSRIKRRIMNK
ncbi:Crp/Fnr family transcriptional regulator [Cyclobacterium sp.]|uniref:Crp/Fnr family transcriptional regulator n=1 Tax=Cyclobacterium sp. TaxID=1966343 RepID=UPI001990D0BA|nr:Crp/Fnr family transcriptional regulator [Cyclobacterium sp.]MBD3629275.1 Crp/Fnr family transcriptional regulator [Cyclobacterium sp.]